MELQDEQLPWTVMTCPLCNMFPLLNITFWKRCENVKELREAIAFLRCEVLMWAKAKRRFVQTNSLCHVVVSLG